MRKQLRLCMGSLGGKPVDTRFGGHAPPPLPPVCNKVLALGPFCIRQAPQGAITGAINVATCSSYDRLSGTRMENQTLTWKHPNIGRHEVVLQSLLCNKAQCLEPLCSCHAQGAIPGAINMRSDINATNTRLHVGRHEAIWKQNKTWYVPWHHKGTNTSICGVSLKQNCEHEISLLNKTPRCIFHMKLGRSPRHQDLGPLHALPMGCECSSSAIKLAHSVCRKTTSHKLK